MPNKPTTLADYVLEMLARKPGLSMRKASEEAGLNVNSIQQIVNGQRPNPRHDTLKAIDTALVATDLWDRARTERHHQSPIHR